MVTNAGPFSDAPPTKKPSMSSCKGTKTACRHAPMSRMQWVEVATPIRSFDLPIMLRRINALIAWNTHQQDASHTCDASSLAFLSLTEPP